MRKAVINVSVLKVTVPVVVPGNLNPLQPHKPLSHAWRVCP